MKYLSIAFFSMAFVPSPIFAVDTNPAAPISRIVFGSCIKQDQPAPIFATMVAERPELVLLTGDNIYADTEDMSVMRKKYQTLASSGAFNELRASSPILATWDDHDYGVNDGGADYPKRKESQHEFLDFFGVPLESSRRKQPGIYDSKILGPDGKRLQIILLDTRYFRSPLKKGEKRVGGPYYPDDTAAKTMLGETQWRWLETQLRQPADIRLIVSSIQFAASAAGQECWANLPRERARMLDLLKSSKAEGVIIISGDRHWSEVSAIRDDVPYPIYDVTCSSLNQLHTRGTPTENRFRVNSKTYHRENYGVIKIDWNAADPLITISIRDIQGTPKIETVLTLQTLAPIRN